MSDINFWLLVSKNKFQLLNHQTGITTECDLNKDALYNLYKEAGYNPVTQVVGYSSSVEIQDPGEVPDGIDTYEIASEAFSQLLSDTKKSMRKNCCPF